jgi:hypothetical protein
MAGMYFVQMQFTAYLIFILNYTVLYIHKSP